MIRIIESATTDIYTNLAYEDVLFESVEFSEDIVLFLWKNAPSVIIGRNQNVYSEVNVEYANSELINIARRRTGGGAVFHDLGNINYSFIFPIVIYDRGVVTQIVIDALAELGIKAESNGRNDIYVDGRKISGNAYYSSKKACLHHGTILLDLDISSMISVLSTDRSKIISKGVKSIYSRVMNIKDVSNNVSFDKLIDGLVNGLKNHYSKETVRKSMLSDIEIEKSKVLRKKYVSEEWVFNQVKEYTFTERKKFQWGYVEISCEMSGNEIIHTSISSDSLYSDLICTIEKSLDKNVIEIEKLKKEYRDSIDKLRVIDDVMLVYKLIVNKTRSC